MFDRLRSHLSVARTALDHERKAKGKRTDFLEKDFLPASLEVLDRPANPLGRTMVWLLVVLFTIAILWACFGRIDVVAQAQGKVALYDRVKLIQPAEAGVVETIYVHDGQSVAKGDILFELDTTVAAADMAQAATAYQSAQLDGLRAEALYHYDSTGKVQFVPPSGVEAGLVAQQKRLVLAEIASFKASDETIHGRIKEAIAEVDSVKEELAKLQETLPLVEEQLLARQELMEKGLSPRLNYLELKERHIAHQRNIEITKKRLVKAQASMGALKKERIKLKQDFRKEVEEFRAQANDDVEIRLAELRKAERRSRLQAIRSPVDGVVQQLAINTEGGVVEPAQTVMIVVPEDGKLVADVMVLNKDIGFISEGDLAEVKLEAFPFTKYGVIDGKIDVISRDAIPDENLGLVYSTRVLLDATSIAVNGRAVPLSPGMTLTAEIKIEERRIIEFILSPLLRYRDEALRER